MTTLSPTRTEPGVTRLQRLKRQLGANLWLFVATAAYLVTLYLVKTHADWSPAQRVAVTLLPLAPGGLYLAKLWSAFKALDELQQRIQMEAWGIALAGTILVGTTLNVLSAHGLGLPSYPHGLEIGGVYLTMFILWSAGTAMANARYR